MTPALRTLVVTPPTAEPSFWQTWIGPAPPLESRPTWHVSPFVDVIAYHLSWAWILIPLAFAGNERSLDYPYWFALVLALNFAHRHYGFPYAYLDRDVFRTHRRRLLVVAALLTLSMVTAPLLFLPNAVGRIGRGFFGAMAALAVVWNLWHTPMQKFGILRLYMAKAEVPADRKTPPWVDRWLIFGWFPVFFVDLGPKNRELILHNGKLVASYLTPVLDVMQRVRPYALGPAILAAMASVGCFLAYEWRAHRWRNVARLSMGGGTFLGFSSLLWLHPVKAFIALAFSHAVEYMVFVWAYQRRRYDHPEAPRSFLQRLVQSGVLYYIPFTVLLGAMSAGHYLWNRTLVPGTAPIRWFGLSLSRWYIVYAVYASLAHFYTDGFLWKMRAPTVRKAI